MSIGFSGRYSGKALRYSFVFCAVFALSFVVGSFFMLPSSSDAVDTEVDITVASVLSLTMDKTTASAEVTPTSSGNLMSSDITASVATNNATGYTLSMSAATAGDVDMVRTGGTDKILNSANTAAGALAANTWGYNLNAGTTPTAYMKIPALTAPATLTTTTAHGNGSTKVTVAANIDMSIPAGTYESELTFTAVGNYVPIPAPIPPAGSNPSNISSTNPAVLDVYPTTGWTGDVVAISSNALFTDVENVTIGGTECSKWGVVNSSLVTCKLPAKTAGTTNDVVVTNNGTNVTPASTYGHMKVTYFNPSSSTVSVGGTAYSFYPNNFTSANCSALTANNSVITSTPAASMAYFRDTRNNQTYKVKKMVDGKCWMVDNLKYISTDMTFNGGGHLNNGGTTAYNTVDESSTQSTANSDKRFYNNPMSSSYCYGTANMPTNSLTRCGYQYNWYAATNGTGTYAQSTAGTNVTGNICPANFRLPSGMSNGSTATSNGTSYAASDFSVLNASMNAGSLTTGSTSNYYAGWRPSGAWGGTFSGSWYDALYSMGSNGYFWSSTVYSTGLARSLYFYSSYVYPGNNVAFYYYYGFPVRCVLP